MYVINLKLYYFVLVGLCCFSCSSQNKQTQNNATVGGPFENRDLMFVSMPTNIKATDTSPGWNQKGQKILISGIIYKKDAKTPAPNIILYYYHTDVYGKYPNAKNLDARAKPHGYIRGWVKSDSNGKYSIYTVKPASYPNSQIMAHIHPAIKEPNIDVPYYIDEWVFNDDPFLTQSQRNNSTNRGGSGILTTTKIDDILVAEHDIILGLNTPNYPEK